VQLFSRVFVQIILRFVQIQKVFVQNLFETSVVFNGDIRAEKEKKGTF